MNRKKKTCKTCGELTYLFSKGDCKQCAQIRYANKSKKVPTERYKKAKECELDTMLSVWEENQDFHDRCLCSECGKSIEFDRSHCAHILSKGAFPQHRCNPENIVILCFDCHQTFDFESRESMAIWPYIEEKTLELKQAA